MDSARANWPLFDRHRFRHLRTRATSARSPEDAMKPPTTTVAIAIALSSLVSGCAEPTVRQQDLDAWVGMPVEALDTQTLFMTMRMVRNKSEDGIETRNYASGRDFASCAGSESAGAVGAYISAEAFSSCVGGWAGCNNLFRIKDGRVVDYAPTGSCTTNASVLPKARFLTPPQAASAASA
jgi:hypothetical protein